ncbi:unnamed protein product [Larinioides sclopetarius]|uniref:Uncharacterized protein n=1 Tax=Larinioides sclopetarius TaxID=280406 RepID=A0AAV1ZAR2_9ARAC
MRSPSPWVSPTPRSSHGSKIGGRNLSGTWRS